MRTLGNGNSKMLKDLSLKKLKSKLIQFLKLYQAEKRLSRSHPEINSMTR